MIWPHATAQHPCPICNGTDWCTFGERAMLCQRVESEHAHDKGGWFHFYETAAPHPQIHAQAPKAPAKAIDCNALMQYWRNKTVMPAFVSFAEALGVLKESLIGLGAAWAQCHKAWAFPMRDGSGDLVGIRLRNLDGFKWAVPGSKNALFIPEPAVRTQPTVYLPEGPTDTAALLSLGLYSIGRPTCHTGNADCKAFLRKIGIHKAVIVADNDEMKRIGSKDQRPGIEGALRLKRELGIPSVIWIPPSPCKDAREFLQRGGTAQMIEADCKNRVWSK